MSEPRRDQAYFDRDQVDELMPTEGDLRAGETADPNVAAEEGLTWVPPIDPPVVPDTDDPEGIQIASGFAVDALEEPYDADHAAELVPREDDLEARVREALRADSATSRYADDLVVGTRFGTVAVRGTVDDVVDTDSVAAVIERVDGVDEVIEELEVRALSE